MSRKDTIIVAVLLNTGLLAVLFMMAVNVDDDKIGVTPETQQIAVITPEPSQTAPEATEIAMLPPASEPTSATSGDELDTILKDYAANVPPQTIVLDDDNGDTIEKEAPIVQPEPQKEKKQTKTAASTSSSSDKLVDITVKKGDSLDKIARANGTTVDAIKKASSLKNDKLKIGQVLKVPVGTKKTAAAEKTGSKKEEIKTVAAAAGPDYYTIKEGDNPWKIAKANKVKFDDLLKLNNLDEEKARNLKAGDKIRVK